MTISTHWSKVVSTATAYLSDIDPIMAQVIARVGPCTLQPNPNVFEALVDAIISQQISVKAADAIMARLRAALPNGERESIETRSASSTDGLYGAVTPHALLLLEHDALRAVGLSTPKARYIRDLTERVISGQLNLERLAELDDEAIIEGLIAVKGIGRWTAEMILIFSLGRTGSFTYLRPGLSRSRSSRADTPQCCLSKTEDQPRIADTVSSETGHTSDVA